MSSVADDILAHYGMPKRSGRYPWGSGEDPYQHGSRDFLSRVEELKKEGWTETPENIKEAFGLTTTQYRIEKGLAKDERRMHEVARVKSLKADGYSNSEIGRIIGKNESTVRSLLDNKSEERMNQARQTANFIKEQVDKKGMVDVGVGVERELGISSEKLKEALYLLEREGYPVYKGGIPQPTNPGQQTNQKVICKPGTEHKEIYQFDKIHSLNEDNYTSHDGGETFDKFVYPKSMDSKRLKIRYAEEGGIDKDGIVEIRRGVDDLSLGESHYSQVRILVDDKKYIKGMAVYSDDMPDGVDVIFNTNKKLGTDKMDVLKDIKNDPDNPFGSLIKANGQSYYIDKNGNKQLSLINKRADEGDWDEWKDALPSQFLGKQSLSMAKKQLDLAKTNKLDEFDTLCSLNNPTVKKHLLNKFADECDSAAVDLQAAALPGQKYHVIIPINSLKDTEVYAPNYENGTKVALIRYPHGGTFEIPILTVNNKHAPAKKLLGTDIVDAVGITSKVAERLSGADFDGDTVMVIPTHDKANKVKITSTPRLKDLESFDPKSAYPERKGMKYMKDPITGKDSTQTQMGMISNLITDMTLGGAGQDELARAVKHSMVVIDAGKHKLDYKQSEIDNNISALKKKYQAQVKEDGTVKYGGASTILSRSKGEEQVPKRQGSPKVNLKGKPWYNPDKPEGSLVYELSDKLEYTVQKVNKRTGEVTTVTKHRTQQSTRMAETDDAYSLVSDARHPMEIVYADYANSMKALANKARIEVSKTGKIAYSKTAKETYAAEVKSLNDKLNTALLNATKERAALRKTNAEVAAKKEADPTMKKSDIKKASQMALTKYRDEVGSVSRRDRSIKIEDREWEAIQAGAISENQLLKILANTDVDNLRQRATPRATNTLSQSKINTIKAMNASNYTLAEIARKLGVSTSTVSSYLKGDK
jgi:DNA-binding CsgD family transcriptional regulator